MTWVMETLMSFGSLPKSKAAPYSVVLRTGWVFSAISLLQNPRNYSQLARSNPVRQSPADLLTAMKTDLRRVLVLALVALAVNPMASQSATSGSFTLVQSLKQFRRLHTATLLSDGRV